MGKIKHIQYINMPRSILVDKDLSENEKKVLSNIINVIGAGGVYRFHNSWIADYLQCHKKSVSRIISRLKNKNIIDIDITRNDKGEVTKRVLTLTSIGIHKYVDRVSPPVLAGGIPSSVEYNNKISNIKDNTKSISKDIQSVFNEFWDKYPRKPIKGRKKIALQRFKKLTQPERAELIIGLDNYSKYKEHSGESIHHAEVFISQKIWEDYMEVPGGNGEPDPATATPEQLKRWGLL